MRILHFITPSHVSGAELLVLRVARAQQASGDIARVLSKEHSCFAERAARMGVDLTTASISGKFNIRAIQVLRQEILRFGPDIVCTHLSSASLWGTLAARSCGVPCISVVHGFTSAICYRRAPALLCVSRAVAASMAHQGIPHARMRVIHNGIDLSDHRECAPVELPIPPGAGCIGTVAHLAAKKGYSELLAAAARLPEAHFVVVGEGGMRRRLARAANTSLRGRLHLLGFRDDIPALMRRFDVFCLPSRREPFGLVLLEAMAARRPVVAFDVGGVPEVVEHGVTGFLARPGSVDDLAGQLSRLLQDPELREGFGEAGFQRVRARFTLDRMVAEIQGMCCDEIARQSADRRGMAPL